MRIRTYIDSVAPANLLDDVTDNLPEAAGGAILLGSYVRTRTLISVPRPTAGTHVFIFTITADTAKVAGGNVATVPAPTGRIAVIPVRTP